MAMTSRLVSRLAIMATVSKVCSSGLRSHGHQKYFRTQPQTARLHPVQRRPSPVRFSFSVSGPGSVNSPLMSSMQSKIKEALETDQVSVVDVNGDGQHVSIEVVSPLFEGKRSLDRQRMVYKAIWEELQSAVHAVDSLVTRAPSEV